MRLTKTGKSGAIWALQNRLAIAGKENEVMKTRSMMVQIHLIVASLFLPLMFMMPLSGALYLLDMEGEQVKENAFVVEGAVPEDKLEKESFFRSQFIKNGIDFDFEYIRESRGDYIFRPTSRVYYMATMEDGALTMKKVTPDFVRRMMEIHKGHGPRLVRTLEIAFGISLILVALSGVWIAVVTPVYRRPMIVSFAIGAAIMACAFF